MRCLQEYYGFTITFSFTMQTGDFTKTLRTDSSTYSTRYKCFQDGCAANNGTICVVALSWLSLRSINILQLPPCSGSKLDLNAAADEEEPTSAVTPIDFSTLSEHMRYFLNLLRGTVLLREENRLLKLVSHRIFKDNLTDSTFWRSSQKR